MFFCQRTTIAYMGIWSVWPGMCIFIYWRVNTHVVCMYTCHLYMLAYMHVCVSMYAFTPSHRMHHTLPSNHWGQIRTYAFCMYAYVCFYPVEGCKRPSRPLGRDTYQYILLCTHIKFYSAGTCIHFYTADKSRKRDTDKCVLYVCFLDTHQNSLSLCCITHTYSYVHGSSCSCYLSPNIAVHTQIHVYKHAYVCVFMDLSQLGNGSTYTHTYTTHTHTHTCIYTHTLRLCLAQSAGTSQIFIS